MHSALPLSIVCLGWGTIPLVADEADMAPQVLTFARVVIAAVVLRLLLAARREPRARPWRTGGRRAVAAGTVLAGHWTAMFAAYERAPDSTVVFLIFLAPIGVAVIERPSPHLVRASVIGLAGLLLVAGPTVGDADSTTAAGMALALLAALLFVVLLVLAKPLAETLGGLRLTFVEMAVASVLLAPVAGLSSWEGIGNAWPWLALLGVVHTALGTAVYLRTLALVPATAVGVLGYLEPVGVVAFAWILAGDEPSLATIIGAAVVVVAGAMAATGSTGRSEVAADVPW
ncbi:MAG TPA: DMT family transporter [Acidimicrobiales bacterium]|nr:DMT family transporter [Acidimicrobiales bacterium]